MRTSRTTIAAAALAVLTVVSASCGANSGVTSERADRADQGAPAATEDTTEETAAEETAPDETSADGVDPPTTSDATEPTPGEDPFGWQEFYPGVETGLLEVPVDYDDPDGPKFQLFVARRLADDQENKIGSLLVNPGGPGFGGTEFAIFADQVYGEELLERFDIVGWDPRGAGLSEPAIDCIDDYDEYFAEPDITPDDDAERQDLVDLAEEFTDACVSKNEEIFEHVGTNDSARDIDSIRRALGEDKISWFGFSYGSELGATWATLFPDTVRAAVLDGAADPTADGVERSLQQAAGFEATLTSYLADCSADSSCAFHNDGDAEGAFDELMASLDEAPIPSTPGRPDVNRAVARQAVVQAMYSESLWEQLSEALAAAQDGEGEGLLALYDAYFRRQTDGTWGNQLEAFVTIHCMDSAERMTVEEEDATVSRFHEVAPRTAPGTTGGYECTFFPPTQDPRAEITGGGAGPIVVVGTTGDPATPLTSSRAMADTLEDGRLVVVDAEEHGGYGVSDCAKDVVHDYLIDLTAPSDETEC